MNALLPCGSDTCWVRVVGTILHADSMLARLLEDPTWLTRKYAAHGPDYTDILWPEQFPVERLKALREAYQAQGNPEGYAQEYLNEPIAIEEAFFNPDYFVDFDRDGNQTFLPNLEYFAAADFAISEDEKADYTAIVVCGLSPEGILYVVDAKRGRWDAEQIIEELVSTQLAWEPNIFTFETEKIDKAIGPFLDRHMGRMIAKYGPKASLNIERMTPSKKKILRARSIQGMHKARLVRYDMKAAWWDEFHTELLTIANSGPKGKHDHYFDAFAYIGLTIDKYFEALSPEEEAEEEYEMFVQEHGYDEGRNATTGY